MSSFFHKNRDFVKYDPSGIFKKEFSSKEYKYACDAARKIRKEKSRKEDWSREDKREKKKILLKSTENEQTFKNCLDKIKIEAKKGNFKCMCDDIGEGYKMELSDMGFSSIGTNKSDVNVEWKCGWSYNDDLTFILGKSKEYIYAHRNAKKISKEKFDNEQIEREIKQKEKGKPVDHIISYRKCLINIRKSAKKGKDHCNCHDINYKHVEILKDLGFCSIDRLGFSKKSDVRVRWSKW